MTTGDFKIGDKVRVVGGWDGSTRNVIGECGTVIQSAHYEYVYCQMDPTPGNAYDHLYFEPDNLVKYVAVPQFTNAQEALKWLEEDDD